MNEVFRGKVALPNDSAQPVGAVRTPSVDDLAALYLGGYHRFVRVAEAITRNPEEACDAVQDGFANALRGLDRFCARGSFEGWVWRCVTNAARMSQRRSSRPAAAALQQPAAVAEKPVLLELISRLPERQRLVLFLRYFADLSYDGIADALEVSPGTVAATLNAAHRALRQHLEEVDDG